MNELFGHLDDLGWVAAKAVLLFLTVVVGFRVAERRTLAQMSIVDFIVAVAVGSIIGRVANARDTSYVQGAMTLVAILVAHRVLTRLRRVPVVARLIDHPPGLLVAHGQIDERELRRAGLTTDELYAVLRQHDVYDLQEVRYAIFEQLGGFSIVREHSPHGDAVGDVLSAVVARAG